MRVRRLTDEPLKVLPEMLGRELAGPWRRALAFAIDYALLFLPTLLLALAVAGVFLHLRDPQGLRALRTLIGGAAEGTPAYHEALRHIAPLLVHVEAPGLPREVREAVERGDLDAAATALDKTRLLVAFNLADHGHETPAPNTVRFPVEALIPKTLQGVCLFGLAAVYFTLFHAGRRGATVGKRIVGIRVARLDGHRLSIPESFERFVGYLHIPGSLGLSLLDFWRDPNRRLPHDRVVHTAVLRLFPERTELEPGTELGLVAQPQPVSEMEPATAPEPVVEPSPEAESVPVTKSALATNPEPASPPNDTPGPARGLLRERL